MKKNFRPGKNVNILLFKDVLTFYIHERIGSIPLVQKPFFFFFFNHKIPVFQGNIYKIRIIGSKIEREY